MNSIEEIKQIGATAVRKLRLKKLSAGQPFMINSRSLPQNQSYLEFPDSTIKIVTVAPGGRSFSEIRKLSAQEASEIRMAYKLI
ncbi:hypothetical protein [Flavobacterium subsaxonicum]|uniref:Uncharacterized protein n=1 Tax=Flavobacterium subsaxonicum WB 4.1-42 = DSM 21790 TaxID=1121898 RepID=A0A0A2MIP2_9FLAO|nr:hypothetical protein [Flavobacterium subsaxonicum]KGO91353.1 hypothetical protein Q766_18190 [Flavobacterium subsaxonicum WB 4.1-42 = DSM 21790]